MSNLTILQAPLPLGMLQSVWQGVESTKQRVDSFTVLRPYGTTRIKYKGEAKLIKAKLQLLSSSPDKIEAQPLCDGIES